MSTDHTLVLNDGSADRLYHVLVDAIPAMAQYVHDEADDFVTTEPTPDALVKVSLAAEDLAVAVRTAAELRATLDGASGSERDDRPALLQLAGAARLYRMDAKAHRSTLLAALEAVDVAQTNPEPSA